MKPIIINKEATIIEGMFTGISGLVVGAELEYNEVQIKVEDKTYIAISRDKVTQ